MHGSLPTMSLGRANKSDVSQPNMRLLNLWFFYLLHLVRCGCGSEPKSWCFKEHDRLLPKKNPESPCDLEDLWRPYPTGPRFGLKSIDFTSFWGVGVPMSIISTNNTKRSTEMARKEKPGRAPDLELLITSIHFLHMKRT